MTNLNAKATGAGVALLAFAMLSSAVAANRTSVPLPRPRPAEAPRPQAAQSAPGKEEAAAPEPPQPSACRLALTEEIAIAPSVPPIKGPGGCGGDDLVRLEAIVLADKTRVALKPAATLRCTMASAVADWVRTDLAALAASLDTSPRTLDNFDSFECRGRNRVAGAMLSEHGKANALDVRSVSFADGRELKLTDRAADRALRESVLHSACARFSTVLGPSSDWYHEDHVHLDLAERRNNYRICEWDVLDPLPAVAPMLPPQRPEEAPPREAANTANAEQGAAKSDAAADKADEKAQPEAEQRPAASPAPDTRKIEPARTTTSKSKGRLKQAPLSAELRKTSP